MKNLDPYLDAILKDWHWPYLRINSNGAREFACPHEVGHGGIHGCDGCCSYKSFKTALKLKVKRKRL